MRVRAVRRQAQHDALARRQVRPDRSQLPQRVLPVDGVPRAHAVDGHVHVDVRPLLEEVEGRVEDAGVGLDPAEDDRLCPLLLRVYK